jgi:SAM-dependent methyltransferase
VSASSNVVWHDVECGGYEADLPLWGELARAQGGPVLDVGAGTGRVAIRLAHAGHEVTALERAGELLAELAARAAAAGLQVETVLAEATAIELPRRYALIAVPMQTLQLLPGAGARADFFAGAAGALAPAGLLAAAIADALEAFDEHAPLPLPDVGAVDGLQYLSQPVAVRPQDGSVRIERVRQIVAPGGERTSEDDVIELQAVIAEGLAEEAAPHGLRAEAPRHVEATDEHVGSTVVMLRGR